MFNFSTLNLQSHPCVSALILEQQALCVLAHYQFMPQTEVPGAYHKSNVHRIIHVFIARVRSEISFKCTHNSVFRDLVSLKEKHCCLWISGFELSLESCRPLPISLTVLHVAYWVENKCTHFFMFIISFPFFTSFSQRAHNKFSLSYRYSFTRVHHKGTFFSPALEDEALSIWWDVAEAPWGCSPHI